MRQGAFAQQLVELAHEGLVVAQLLRLLGYSSTLFVIFLRNAFLVILPDVLTDEKVLLLTLLLVFLPGP